MDKQQYLRTLFFLQRHFSIKKLLPGLEKRIEYLLSNPKLASQNESFLGLAYLWFFEGTQR